MTDSSVVAALAVRLTARRKLSLIDTSSGQCEAHRKAGIDPDRSDPRAEKSSPISSFAQLDDTSTALIYTYYRNVVESAACYLRTNFNLR